MTRLVTEKEEHVTPFELKLLLRVHDKCPEQRQDQVYTDSEGSATEDDALSADTSGEGVASNNCFCSLCACFFLLKNSREGGWIGWGGVEG